MPYKCFAQRWPVRRGLQACRRVAGAMEAQEGRRFPLPEDAAFSVEMVKYVPGDKGAPSACGTPRSVLPIHPRSRTSGSSADPRRLLALQGDHLYWPALPALLFAATASSLFFCHQHRKLAQTHSHIVVAT